MTRQGRQRGEVRRDTSLASVANNTKWQELRAVMLGMPKQPQFRRQSLSGQCTAPDSEWFYHFSDGGYDDMEYVDLLLGEQIDRTEILSKLKAIGLAGHSTNEGFRVFGYIRPGYVVDYF